MLGTSSIGTRSRTAIYNSQMSWMIKWLFGLLPKTPIRNYPEREPNESWEDYLERIL